MTLTSRSEGLVIISMNNRQGTEKYRQRNLVVPFNDTRMRLIPGSSRRGTELKKNTNTGIDVINLGTFEPHVCKTLGHLGFMVWTKMTYI